jgi:hypothetical protein
VDFRRSYCLRILLAASFLYHAVLLAGHGRRSEVVLRVNFNIRLCIRFRFGHVQEEIYRD